MNEDISNRTLAILLAVSIVISLGGLVAFMSKGGDEITGAAISPTALARINITSRASINWTINTIDWGTGYVNETAQFCILNSEGENNPTNCTNFTTVTQGLILENDGNRVVSVNFSSNVTPAQFLGGTDPWFQWKLSNNEDNSCGTHIAGNACAINSSALQNQSYTTILATSAEICPCFKFQNANDTIRTDLQVKVPSDSYIGVREATITAIATVV